MSKVLGCIFLALTTTVMLFLVSLLLIKHFLRNGFCGLVSRLPMVVKRNLKNTGGSIPKIIYICNKTIKDIPESTVQRWKSLNPNYLVKLFGNKECEDYLKKSYGKEIAHGFAEIPDGPIKADFWRVCILYEFGGVYVDVDMVPLKPLDHILMTKDGSSCKNTTFCVPGSGVFWKTVNPCFIASIPKNPILLDCLYLYEHLFKHEHYSYWQFSIVTVLTKVLENYMVINNQARTIMSGNQCIKMLKETYTNFMGIPSLCNGIKCNNDFVENEDGEKLFKTRSDSYDRFKHQFVSLLKLKKQSKPTILIAKKQNSKRGWTKENLCGLTGGFTHLTHIPKTGGSSLKKVMSEKYQNNVPCDRFKWCDYTNYDCGVVEASGRYHLTLDEYKKCGVEVDDTRTLCVIRDPLERLESEMRWSHRNGWGKDKFFAKCKKIGNPLIDHDMYTHCYRNQVDYLYDPHNSPSCDVVVSTENISELQPCFEKKIPKINSTNENAPKFNYIKTPEYQKILKEFLQEHFQKDLKSDVLQKALAGHIMVKRGDKYEILK